MITIKFKRLRALHTPFFSTQSQLSELRESIKQNGLIVPLVVRKAKMKWWQWWQDYQIIDGYARFLACESLGYKEILCDVLSINDEQLIQARIIASNKRVATSPEQYARAIKFWMAHTGITLTEVAKKLGKSIEEIQDVLKHAT